MVPPILLRQLGRLRWRERWLRLAWGATLGVTMLAALMGVCCLIDWIIDRSDDTPFTLRVLMLASQASLWLFGALVLWNWAFELNQSDDEMALLVEDRVPALGHRLISALQLNRRGARTLGMSPALIAVATREAEQQAGHLDFPCLADHRRLRWAGGLAAGLAVVVGPLAVFCYPTVSALVARQFLADAEIPRSLRIESAAAHQVWPSGEEVLLRFKVSNPDGLPAGLAEASGEVRIRLEAESAGESYPLAFVEQVSPTEAWFSARVRPTTSSYSYRAWLVDGRTRRPAQVQVEPRPAIVKQEAWVQLPLYTGRRPSGLPYEVHKPQGDITGLPDTSARVAIGTQKPVKEAVLEIIGQLPLDVLSCLTGPGLDAPGVPHSGVSSWLGLALLGAGDLDAGDDAAQRGIRSTLRPEAVLRTIKMEIAPGGKQAEAVFPLHPGQTAYRIVVRDQYDFANADPPRRTIRMDSEEPPVVALLPEYFFEGRAPTDDDQVEGVPVLYKGKFRVAYTASSPYGLGKALMRYRINEGEWLPLPMKEVPAGKGERRRDFDLRQGAFVDSSFFEEIEFYQVPSADDERFPPGTEGGGRFDFKTAGIPELQVGDKIEFFMEVFDRNPALDRLPGRSEVRLKTVVDLDQFRAWRDSVQQEESRVRALESKQRSVFGSAIAVDLPPTTTKGTPITKPDPRVTSKPPSGFVRSWQVIGPFPSSNDGSGFDRAFPIEEDKNLDLGKVHDGAKGKIRWKAHHSGGDLVDLEKALKHSDAGVAYAVCWFRSTYDDVILATGSDDGIKVWIDRKEVLAKKTRRDAVPGEEKTPVKLQEAEWHELLVKVDNRTGSWGFYLEVLDATTGKPQPGITFRATHPSEDDKRFVREWQIIGPFPNVGDAGRNRAHPPELEPVDLDKEYDGIGGKVGWKLHRSETGRIGLDKFFGRPPNESNLAYAVCWVKRPDTARDDPVLATGSDDGIKVWVNRKVRIDAAVTRDAEPGKDLQPIKLQRGWNEILVKVDNRFARWAFYLELRDPNTEQPLEGLEFSSTPPKD